jgi:hypothetical protein
MGGHGLGSSGSRQGQMADSWEHVRDLWVPSNAGNFFIRWESTAPQEGLCPISCLTQNDINTYFDFIKLKLLLVNAWTSVVYK